MSKRILRMELFNQPTFWAVHSWNITKGPLADTDLDNNESSFGMSTDVIEAFYLRELNNEEEWPFFRIPLYSGFSLEVEYANYPEDHQIFYKVCHDKWVRVLTIGKSGGSWQLPAFRCIELFKVINVIAQKDTQSAVHALLLLFPTIWLGKDDDLTDVRRHLFDAWSQLNIMSKRQAEIITERWIDSSQSDVIWDCHPRLGWINNGDNSRRNPKSTATMTGLEFDQFRSFMKSFDN